MTFTRTRQLARSLTRPAAQAGRVTGRSRVDPILSRSLLLAGFGLGLMALGRALALARPQGKRSQWTIREALRCGHSEIIPWRADVLPSD